MSRRNAIVWNTFYSENQFCDHITFENGQSIQRSLSYSTKNNTKTYKWICNQCKDKPNIYKIVNNDKGKNIKEINL